jgi:hypothetical protein
MYELSLVELESELSAELPTRDLMCCRRRRKKHHRHHSGNGGNNGTSANNGSVANSNSTKQVIFNPQVAIVTGVNGGGAGVQGNGALITQAGLNSNSNTNTQFGVPVNFAA